MNSSCHVYYSNVYPHGVVYFCVYCQHSTRSDDSRDCSAVLSEKTGILYRCHDLCRQVCDDREYALREALVIGVSSTQKPRYLSRRRNVFGKV